MNARIILSTALAVLFSGTAGAALSVKEITNTPLLKIWSIKEPNVKQADTAYSQIQFQPGQTVTLSNVGGCVQTGGSGKTWKRYVDPSGPNSDHLYHGTIRLPGMGKSMRVIDFKNTYGNGYTIPASAAGDLSLHLGYEDDNYSDNGYWSHDNGTENQCRASVNAFVELTIKGRPYDPATWTGTPLAGATVHGTERLDFKADASADLVWVDAYWAATPADSHTLAWHRLGNASRDAADNKLWHYSWDTTAVPDQGDASLGTVNVKVTSSVSGASIPAPADHSNERLFTVRNHLH